jgi:hypothetical protein
MSMISTRAHPGPGWWIGQGALGGVIAGLVFAVFETVAAIVMEGIGAMFMPIRMISGIVLGPAALDPAYPLVTALIAGVLLHVVLSAIFGAIIGAIGFLLPAVSHVSGRWLLMTTSLGFALWIVNFYVIAPAAGWLWFTLMTNPVIQAGAHMFFFGSILGFYLYRALVTRSEAEELNAIDEREYHLPRAA